MNNFNIDTFCDFAAAAKEELMMVEGDDVKALAAAFNKNVRVLKIILDYISCGKEEPPRDWIEVNRNGCSAVTLECSGCGYRDVVFGNMLPCYCGGCGHRMRERRVVRGE